MNDTREKLVEILRKPIFPHELVDPIEAVADYLLDNDVVPVVRCEGCEYWHKKYEIKGICLKHNSIMTFTPPKFYCAFGERKSENETKCTDFEVGGAKNE